VDDSDILEKKKAWFLWERT